MYLELDHWLQWSLMPWSRFSYTLADWFSIYSSSFPTIVHAPKDSVQLSEITLIIDRVRLFRPYIEIGERANFSLHSSEAHYCVRNI